MGELQGGVSGNGKMNFQDVERTDLARIAEAVQRFYDRHPYPPPVDNLDRYREAWRDPVRRRAEYHLPWPDKPYRNNQDILVAGCGTSQAARHALCDPASNVVGIDVSSTSIRHTESLKRRYRLSNLELYQLPVERSHELDQRFDKVVCTGVLHHLPDPDAGLRSLCTVLKPDGAIHLMVYATYGRTGIYMLQEYCRRLGIGNSDREVRELADTLTMLPQDHPLVPLLSESPDFKRKDGLSDALLHPNDRAYTVPQLLDFIDRAGLTFGRWVRQAPYLPQCGVLAHTPHSSRLSELTPPEQYAAVELFRGTMIRHSAIVFRSDRPGDSRPVTFGDDGWYRYVPIRLPGTICVDEHLPSGAAAVLINQSHRYSDLVLPIDEEEKRLYEAIDGRRTIVEILEEVTLKNRSRNCEVARSFFEELWLYDQVVFDTSK
jgi:2-polyprenyl-3-methyl-5-hydroxy-6-metoxy-1,4-benzoquinol methylase